MISDLKKPKPNQKTLKNKTKLKNLVTQHQNTVLPIFSAEPTYFFYHLMNNICQSYYNIIISWLSPISVLVLDKECPDTCSSTFPIRISSLGTRDPLLENIHYLYHTCQRGFKIAFLTSQTKVANTEHQRAPWIPPYRSPLCSQNLAFLPSHIMFPEFKPQCFRCHYPQAAVLSHIPHTSKKYGPGVCSYLLPTSSLCTAFSLFLEPLDYLNSHTGKFFWGSH